MEVPNGLCEKHTEQIEEVLKLVRSIETALLGSCSDIRNEGFIPRTNRRLNELEGFKRIWIKVNWIVFGALTVALVGAIATQLF